MLYFSTSSCRVYEFGGDVPVVVNQRRMEDGGAIFRISKTVVGQRQIEFSDTLAQLTDLRNIILADCIQQLLTNRFSSLVLRFRRRNGAPTRRGVLQVKSSQL